MTGASWESAIEWASASTPHPGEASSGDLHLVIERPYGLLVSVMDGLGHGPEATEAVTIAAGVLLNNAKASLLDLFSESHRALRGSRGIALTVADIDLSRKAVTWAGVGNVEGRLIRAHPNPDRKNESVLLRGGVVGFQMPSLSLGTHYLEPEDLLIFATDGISPQFADGIILNQPPQQLAEGIMINHNRGMDDALVVIGKYLGRSGSE